MSPEAEGDTLLGVRLLGALATCVVLVLVPAGRLAAVGVPPCTISWTGGPSGFWNVATNWDLGRVPAAADHVCIAAGANVTHNTGTTSVLTVQVAGTLTLTGGTLTTTSTADDSQIVKLMQGGGTLAGANAVVLTGSGANTSSWIGGTMSGAGTTRVASGAALNISGSAAVSLADGRTLDMRGTVTWSGTVLILQAGSPASVLTVGPGGLFDITGNSTTYVQLRVLPGGTLRKSGASGTTQIGTSLKNGGRIEVLSGFLVVSGLFRNFSGNALVGGEYLVQGTFRFLGANIVTNAANVTLDGPSAAIEDPGGSDAFANLARNARGGSLALIGGRDLTVAGPFTNSGTLVASSGSTFAVANNAFTNSFGGVLRGPATSTRT